MGARLPPSATVAGSVDPSEAPVEGSDDLFAGLVARLRRRPDLLVLAGMVSIFLAVFATVTVLRYWNFDTYAWDLGIYNQAMYTTVFSGRFFFYTADLPSGYHGSLFAVHFSPFLLLLLPIYAVLPGPTTLLVVQAVAVALAALPLYGLAAARLGSSRWGLLVAAVYLASPAAQGLTWYDFHPESFLPLTVLTSFYFLEKRNPYGFLAGWVLSLTVVEEIAPLLLLFALFSLLGVLRPWRSARSAAPVLPHRAQLPVAWLVTALLIALAWIVLAYAALVGEGALGGASYGSNYAVNWSILQAPSLLWVFPQALLHPSLAAQALSFDASSKLLYLLLLFGPLAFLPWAGEDRYLFPALAWIGLAILSNDPGYYQLGDQYPGYVIPFLMVGTIGGVQYVRSRLARLRDARPSWTRPISAMLQKVPRPVRWLSSGDRPVAASILMAVLLAALVASPLLSAPVGGYDEITFGVPSTTPDDTLLHQVIEEIPAHASVLTTTSIFPEVSGRLNAFVLPTSSFFATGTTFGSAVDQEVNASNFILVDYAEDPFSAAILSTYANLSGFGLAAQAGGAYLYERGWSGPPALYDPWPGVEVPAGSLTAGDAVLEPQLPGAPLFHAANSQGGTELWSGLDLYPTPPADYQVTWELRVTGGQPTSVALKASLLRIPLSVTAQVINPSAFGHDYGFAESFDDGAVVTANVTSVTPGAGSGWENVTAVVAWPSVGEMESQGWIADPTANVWLYGISVEELSSGPG